MTMDRETVETLRDEPELLALADALQSAGDALDVPDPAPVRPRTRLRPARLAAVGFAVAAVVGLVLASPWSGSGGPSFVDKALAAVGDRPVVHVVVRYSIGERVDLQSGRTVPVRYVAEVWYDAARHVYRVVVRVGGRVITRNSGTGNIGYEPFLLADVYRRALEHKKVHATGKAVIGGRPVIVLDGPQPGGGRMRAYLDPHSYQLVRLQYLVHGRIGYELDVLRFETVTRAEAHLPKPTPGHSSTFGSGSSTVTSSSLGDFRSLDPAKARALFARPPLWAGVAVGRHALASIQAEKVAVTGAGKTVRGRTLELDYGAGGSTGADPAVKIEETPLSEAALLQAQNSYVPPAGYVDLVSGQSTRGGGPTVTVWTGKMRKDGFYVELTTRSRPLLIAVARALRPLP